MLRKIMLRKILLSVILVSVIIFRSKDNEVFSKDNNFDHLTDKRTCNTVEYMESLYRQNPAYKEKMEGLEKYAEEYTKLHKNERDSRGIIIIPCVVHVVWNTPIQNISEDQVLSQIDVLNADFRRRNFDTINTPIPFKPLGAD